VEAQQKSNLTDWFASPRGEYVLRWEHAQFDRAVEDVVGFNAVQIGLPGIDLLRQNRIPLRTRVTPLEALKFRFPSCGDCAVSPATGLAPEPPGRAIREALPGACRPCA
jgi:hypothetical protein